MPTLGPMRSLDRMSARRADADFIAAAQMNADARHLLMVERCPSIVGSDDGKASRLRWFVRAEIEAFGLANHPMLFLGADATGRGHFALDLSEHRARAIAGGPFILKPYVDLRTLAVEDRLGAEELSLAGQARALAEWHRTHRCCGHCGSTTDVKDGGWRRKCWSCGQEHFPRTDPVVIMLVTEGDCCLLTREPRFAATMYSALAGFLEPGEDIEHAVRREVMEEVGLEIDSVAYQESQPWPFPHSLMIGCRARARSRALRLDPNEITAARWVTRTEAAAMLDGRHADGLTAPGRHAIAHKLIRAFVGAAT